MPRDIFSEIRAPKVRIRTPGDGSGEAITITAGGTDDEMTSTSFPAKEWSIIDDMMNISDSASVSIANDNGENSGKFSLGQKIIIDESDPSVANGRWLAQFTGRITALESYSDIGGGSNIMITAMDLGWHLTSCHATPHKNIKNAKTLGKLLDILIHPTWGFKKANGQLVVQTDASLNTRLKHGRQVIQQQITETEKAGAILPFIQVEIGQTPFEVLTLYLARAGLLLNVGAEGQLIFFNPNYEDSALYRASYHGTGSGQSSKNNVIGRPTLRVKIDGLFSATQCWSTLILPPVRETDNPNGLFTQAVHTVSPNPVPFFRLHAFSDSEAIGPELRTNRAIWKAQMEAFNSWEYSCEFPSHSQDGGFFVSNTMISIDDTVNGARKAGSRDPIPRGLYYVQSVRRSLTLREGLRSRLTIRKPGLLNPALARLGGGAKRSSKTAKVVS